MRSFITRLILEGIIVANLDSVQQGLMYRYENRLVKITKINDGMLTIRNLLGYTRKVNCIDFMRDASEVNQLTARE